MQYTECKNKNTTEQRCLNWREQNSLPPLQNWGGQKKNQRRGLNWTSKISQGQRMLQFHHIAIHFIFSFNSTSVRKVFFFFFYFHILLLSQNQLTYFKNILTRIRKASCGLITPHRTGRYSLYLCVGYAEFMDYSKQKPPFSFAAIRNIRFAYEEFSYLTKPNSWVRLTFQK